MFTKIKMMDKQNKYRFIFESAKRFLNEIISKHPDLNSSILAKHLEHESKFEDISDVHRRLIESLSNRSMMASVIGFNRREKEIRTILFEYNLTEILGDYKNADKLLEKFNARVDGKSDNQKILKEAPLGEEEEVSDEHAGTAGS